MGKSRIRGSAAAIGLSCALFGSPCADAHHSFAAVFDASRPVKLTGTITRVEWANPHIWFYVNVTDDDGRLAEWGFSGAPPGVLMRRGITKDALKIGAVVNVEGFLARDGSRNASAVASLSPTAVTCSRPRTKMPCPDARNRERRQ